MGISTDAYLVWGIQVEEGWGQDVDEPEDEDPSVEYRLAANGDTVDGVRAVSHCSDDCTMFILTDVAHVRAWRGDPCPVNPTALVNGDANKIRAFAAEHNIPLTGEPGWWLCSWWC